MRPVTFGRILLAFAAALSVLATGAEAWAQEPYELKVIEPKAPAEGEEGQEAKGDGVPFLRAITNGRPGLTVKEFVLKQTDAQPPLAIEASKSVTYRESDEPMAMVVLVQGNFRWIGNETYTDPSDPEAGSIYDGAFKGLGPAIDALAKAGPPGSTGALLVYAEGKALVKQNMGDVEGLSSAVLGSQQDYSEFISKPFVLGLNEAWKLLANQADKRRILVVFGDGQDDQAEIAAELKKVVSDLKDADVEVYSVFYSAMPEDGPQGQQNMAKVGYSESLTATSRDNFASLADNIVEAIGAKYYVDFPGEEVVWDGLEHEFVLVVDGEEREPKMLTIPTVVRKKADEGGSLWWLWLLLIIIAIIIIVVVVKKKRANQGYIEPMPEMPLEPMPAAPLAPAKTIMLGVGGNEDSLPIVGWVVPLHGPNQFQTYKLSQGGTKFGTGGESAIIIGDSYMSTEHAEIVCTAGGFILKDLGSTNGTYVNETRVSSHELVDNDVFKLGQTDFKFKSIN